MHANLLKEGVVEHSDSLVSLLGCGFWVAVFSLVAAGFLTVAAALGSCAAG